MATDEKMNLRAGDAFSPIANYYDAIMEHVDYARWLHIADSLATLLPRPFLHLDAGCGTGIFMEQLRQAGWHSAGMDLSPTMLRVAKYRRELTALARADLCALPCNERFHLVTCLFDSLNFLLYEEQIGAAFRSFQQALVPGGLLYFDAITRKMITDHFNNESWEENHGRFRSSWRSTYDRNTSMCETRVRINSGEDSITYERVYAEDFLCDALKQAGLTLLATRDAYTWKKVGRRTTRVDFVAVKPPAQGVNRRFPEVELLISEYLRHGRKS